ncbi:MAG: lysophospholipid acyltransferase family protein [Pseudomonadota bacterium]|nr:lysophospholipid acyltransferase family protein [Pseudomonadota bacterium]
MTILRLVVRSVLFILCLAGIALVAIGLRLGDLVRRTPANRNPWASACFRQACRCLGWQVQVHGQARAGATLFVANHISWSDIPLLGGLVPGRFLSKAEVADWPIIGWLAQQAGTLFIRRGSGQARRVKTEIHNRLSAGESVVVFPEGTTTSGIAVLPMHGLLLGAARDAGVPVQPVTLGYRRHQRPDALAPFVGDDAFHRHLIRLLKQPPLKVVVIFHEPVLLDESPMPETMAALHQTISAGLKRIHDGEFDGGFAEADLRTTGGPGPLRPVSHPDARQSPGQSTG